MTVGDRIRELIEASDMNQTEIANKIGVSKQTMYKYVNNITTNIPSDKIEKMAEVFNVSPCYLMGWKMKESDKNHFHINELEKQIITSYRSADEIGKAIVLRTLGIEDAGKKEIERAV